MVEIKYDESSGQLRLPKNIRQIGKTQGQTKIYVEDYVITFINQLAQISPMEPKLAILLGYTVKKDDLDYVFIHGAIEAAGVNIQEDHIGFTSGIWSKIYEDIKTYFGDAKVAGWFLTRPGKALKITEKIRKIHVDNFPGENKALFVIDPLDSDEAFYIYKKGELVQQEGYYIYYERNEEMQNYMIENKNQRDSKDIMNQVIVDDHVSDDHETDTTFSAKLSKKTLKKASKKAFGKTSKKASKKASKISSDILTAKETSEKQKPDYNKTMNKMTRYAAMFVLLVVVAAGVVAVRNRNGDFLPVWSPLSGENDADAKDLSTTENVQGQNADHETNDQKNDSISGADNGTSSNAAGSTENVNNDGNTGGADGVNGSDGTNNANAGDGILGGQAQNSVSENTQGTSGGQGVTASVSASAGKTYQIQDGDTLAGISRRYYNDYKHVEDICALNGIEDADTIFPGMTILLP